MKASIRQVIDGLEQGKITRQEADTYLRKEHSTTLAQETREGNHALAVSSLVIMVLAIGIGIFYLPGGLTGYIVLDGNHTSLNDTNITIDQPFSGLTVSGSMMGEGSATILLHVDNSSYLIATIKSDTGEPRTAKASYSPGENITVSNVMDENATYYLDDGLEVQIVEVPFPAPAIGEYEILILENRTEEVVSTRTSLIVSEQDMNRTTVFDECGEACDVEAEEGVLEIRTENTTLDLVITLGEQQKPPRAADIPDMTIEETIQINLGQYFTDPNGDEILYSTSTGQIIDLDVDGDILTIQPLANGSEVVTVYASDLTEIVSASFTVSVVVQDNESQNTTVNDTSAIQEPQQNTTRQASPQALCNHPDPNKRSIDCLQEDSERYFQGQTMLRDSNNMPVARVNRLGNLIIAGEVHENSEFTARQGDYQISYQTNYGDTVTTVWFDGETGDLYLTGNLFEEQITLEPRPGSYAVKNRQGITMMWADQTTGDLYLRGNLISRRGDVR